MINEQMRGLGAAPSEIRQIFAYGLERKAAIGEDGVFDFSIGNPSIPAPAAIGRAIADLLSQPSARIHGYTAAPGSAEVRQAVAGNLNRRFGASYGPDNLYMTMGAAAALDATIHALCNAGDEVIVISPCFPEYRMWIEAAGCSCVDVPARASDFQADAEAIAAAITPRTKAVIMNSPNNPVGAVYGAETVAALAAVLRTAEEAHGHAIYLISDEPYRELVYGDAVVPWVPDFYDDALVCYSWSKSFSLPGERIGYVLVPDAVGSSRDVYDAVCGAGRALGYVCASSLFQGVIARCVDEPVDIGAYERNRALLRGILDELGYGYVDPAGAFYLWMRALEPDARAFCARAKRHELLFVPSDGFGVPGWVRIGYCVGEETILNSREAFAALREEYR